MSADLHDFVTRKNIGAAKGLLQSLVPRAQCFCFYDLTRACVWSSDGADDYETGQRYGARKNLLEHVRLQVSDGIF